MSDIYELLGEDRDAPWNSLARSLVREDAELIKALVMTRERNGLSPLTVAALMGISPADVARIECGQDVTLSTLRRYALAVGASITHRVRTGRRERLTVRHLLDNLRVVVNP